VKHTAHLQSITKDSEPHYCSFLIEATLASLKLIIERARQRERASASIQAFMAQKRSKTKMMIQKASKIQLTWPFFLILFIHVVGILLFTRGFLLTRTELPHHSNCSDVSLSPCIPPSSSSSSSSSSTQDGNGTCWTKPAIDRLVIIVFDALR